MRSLRFFLILLLACPLHSAYADDDENLEAITAQALIRAALNLPQVQPLIAKHEKQTLRMRHRVRKHALDFRVSLPDGVGGAFSYTPHFPITAEIAAGSTGATVGVSAGVTFLFRRNKNFTPIITLKFSHIRFTSYADTLAHYFIPNWPMEGEDQVIVKMAGRWFNAGTLLGGVDWVSPYKGVHLLARFGVTRQIGESGGGEEPNGKLKFSEWIGPAMDLGIGGAF